MSYELTIRDETASGQILQEIVLKLKDQLTTVEEIIKARVIHEVASHNNNQTNLFKGLVQPLETEVSSKGFRFRKKPKSIDPDKQISTALKAFKSNGFFVLIGAQQYEHLDSEVLLEPDTTVSFIKLTPLVGG